MSSVYERKSKEFELHAETSAYNALYDRPAMLELLGDVRGLDVLDAGCGPGLYAEELVRRGARVVGVDGSPRMIELAKARLGNRATFRVHDLATPLDWATEGSFDAVVMALVIHHVDDRVSLLRELFRILRAGGHLVISTHHPVADWIRLGGSYFDIKLVEEVWQGDWDMRYWRQPLTATCSEVAEAGFLIEAIVEPQPPARMAESFPEEFQKLSQQPGFLMLRLVRPE